MPRTVKKDKNLHPGQPIKPADLAPDVAREWDRLMSEIEKASIQLSPAHRAPLELAASIAADIISDRTRLKADGYYITTKAGLVAHPASKRLDALRRDYIKILSMLGLRTAVAGHAPSKEPSLDELLGEG